MTTVGLFGTCGESRWREPFIAAFEAAAIPYFNPQLPPGTWTPRSVADENRHLAEDGLILFPVTGETTGIGSLGEIGFSALHALRTNRFRSMIFMIDDTCTAEGIDPALVKESNRLRALVKSKLQDEARRSPSIMLVDDLAEMLRIAIPTWEAIVDYEAVRESVRASSVA